MSTVIGKNLNIDGEITGSGPISILGSMRGKIETDSSVEIVKDASVEADILASNVSVSGTLTGNVEAKEKLVIEESGELIGNVRSKRISIKEGAVFKGQIDMD